MGIYLIKTYQNFIFNQDLNFDLEKFIQKKGDEKNIIKLTNPILNILISKIELKITTLEFIFIDYQKDNYFDRIELLEKEYKITKNNLEIYLNNINKNYIDDCFLTTELILKKNKDKKKNS